MSIELRKDCDNVVVVRTSMGDSPTSSWPSCAGSSADMP